MRMSLRAILILWIGFVLVASLSVGGVLVYWHAVQKVDVEMRGVERAADLIRFAMAMRET